MYLSDIEKDIKVSCDIAHKLNATGSPSSGDPLTDIREVVKTYQCMTEYNEMSNFFNDTSNEAATLAALDMYGLSPKNRPSERPCWLCKWKNFCDWDKGILKLYEAAKLYKLYPQLKLEKVNCRKIEGIVPLLEQEKLNIDKLATNKTAISEANSEQLRTLRLSVVNDMQSKYLSAYTSLNCEEFIATMDERKIIAQVEAAKDKSKKEATRLTTPKLFIYGISGVIVLLSIVMLLRKND
jgi:hypothetical protein